MTFEDLKGKIIQMDENKGWSDGQPGDLAKSIMLESAELLEYFQWDDTIRFRGQKILSKNKNEIGKEMADILIYLIKMSNKMDIDLINVTINKIDEIQKR
ncbi:MazG-like family protein [Aquimarina sp. Aq78]|uniref:MazG-like family protein n=1 Tax=Aquimarina sp. Aq78 TaxID=1191889 RepID=UPI000D0E92EC|nr:MazG-like family protein [Aquimarina sp. Aq78]